jgi:hypothetical protein
MRVLAVVVALLALVIVLAARAPATLLDAPVAATSRGALRLADAQGTVWRGSGNVTGSDGQWSVPLAWRLAPWPLLRGALVVTLVPEGDARARGNLDLVDDALALASLHAVVPAAAMSAALPPRSGVALAGTLTVDAPSLQLAPGAARGTFTAQWDRAQLAVGGLVLDLGAVEARGEPAGNGMRVHLAGHGGDATLDGTARLDRGVVALDATLTPAATLSPALAALLRALGPPAPGGGVRLAWQGRW